MTARVVCTCLLLLPAVAAAQTQREIFHIMSSRTPNVVRYDGRLTKDGELDPKQPVVAYRQRPNGSTYAVSKVDMYFYGFKVKLDQSGKFWHFTIKAAKDRHMKLYLVDGHPKAEGRIAGVQAYVKKFYVKFKPDTVIPGVEWVDLHGTEIGTGRAVHERVVPK